MGVRSNNDTISVSFVSVYTHTVQACQGVGYRDHQLTLDETACNQTVIGRTSSEMGPSYETTTDATIHASPEAKEDSEDTSRL